MGCVWSHQRQWSGAAVAAAVAVDKLRSEGWGRCVGVLSYNGGVSARPSAAAPGHVVNRRRRERGGGQCGLCRRCGSSANSALLCRPRRQLVRRPDDPAAGVGSALSAVTRHWEPLHGGP